MPVYNAEKYVEEAIKSILNQTFKDFEFIIIDDCSTDSTASKVQKYFHDARIRYYKNVLNCGESFSLNHGIRRSLGRFVAIMHADDISLPDRLLKQIQYFSKHPEYDVLGTNVFLTKVNGEKMRIIEKPQHHTEIKKIIFKFAPIVHPSAMFRKTFFLKYGLYDESISRAPDYELWLRTIFMGAKIGNIQESLLLYRFHNEQLTARMREQAKVTLKLVHEIIKRHDLSLTMREWAFVYGRYVIGVFLPRYVSDFCEKLYKKIYYR